MQMTTNDARRSLMEPDNSHLDEWDTAALAETVAGFRAREADVPLVGEFVRFACGTLRRISHVWEWGKGPESIQTSEGGSYHLASRASLRTPGGFISHSGGLFPGVKPEHFTLTEERLPGIVWIWHHGRACAHNGIDVTVSFRVWSVDQEANR